MRAPWAVHGHTMSVNLAAMLTFPILLLVGLGGGAVLKWLGITLEPSDTPLVSRNGVLNLTFAARAFEIFGTLFILILLYSFKYKSPRVNYLGSHNSLLPTNESDSTDVVSTVSKKQILLRQGIKLGTLYVWLSSLICWFFGDSIFERILKATGGHCSADSNKLGYHECLANGEYTWVGGVKLSGHSLILSCFATTLIMEMGSLYQLYRVNLADDIYSPRENRIPKQLFIVIATVACTVAAIWSFMYLVTATFYHTVFEKLVGTLCGLLIPYIFDFRYADYFSILL